MKKIVSKVRMTSREDGSFTLIGFDEANERLFNFYEFDISTMLMRGEEIQTSFFYYQLEVRV